MTPRILELGVGARPTPGVTVRHDRIKHADYIDTAHDLDLLPWPWQDAEFDKVIALDVMEHVQLEIWQWLAEVWRILKPGGLFVFRVPNALNPVSFRDPTHRDLRSLYTPEKMDYFCKGTDLWNDYGRFYPGSELGRWWEKVSVNETNPDIRYGVGDLGFVLKKVIE